MDAPTAAATPAAAPAAAAPNAAAAPIHHTSRHPERPCVSVHYKDIKCSIALARDNLALIRDQVRAAGNSVPAHLAQDFDWIHPGLLNLESFARWCFTSVASEAAAAGDDLPSYLDAAFIPAFRELALKNDYARFYYKELWRIAARVCMCLTVTEQTLAIGRRECELAAQRADEERRRREEEGRTLWADLYPAEAYIL